MSARNFSETPSHGHGQPAVKPARRSVIDIGTNSVKLLVGEVSSSGITPLIEESRQTRLGKGFYKEHILAAEAIENTAQVVAEFVKKTAELGSTPPLAVATSAARDAKNQSELLRVVKNKSGLAIRVLSGEEEAHYAYKGVSSDPGFHAAPLLLMDVGGGSTEFILGTKGQTHFSESFPLGTVRLMEQLKISDPPTETELKDCRERLQKFLSGEVAPALEPHLQEQNLRTPLLVGTGGTSSILAAMEAELKTFDRARLESVRLGAERVRHHVRRLWGMTLSERKSLSGLPQNRADVILTGAAIFEAVMVYFNLPEMRVSTRGLRFALLEEQNERAECR